MWQYWGGVQGFVAGHGSNQLIFPRLDNRIASCFTLTTKTFVALSKCLWEIRGGACPVSPPLAAVLLREINATVHNTTTESNAT